MLVAEMELGLGFIDSYNVVGLKAVRMGHTDFFFWACPKN
jgi:hypothetical protein